MNEELEKFKKNRQLFSLIVVVSFLVISVAFLFYIFFAKKEFTKVTQIICWVYLGIVLLILIMFTVFDIVRMKLIRKYFGKVSVEDKELAKMLYTQADNFKEEFEKADEEYAIKTDLEEDVKTMIEDEEYDYFKSYNMTKLFLKSIKRKQKVYSDLVDDFNKYKTIMTRTNNPEFTNFINQLLPLLERNRTEI